MLTVRTRCRSAHSEQHVWERRGLDKALRCYLCGMETQATMRDLLLPFWSRLMGTFERVL